MNKLIVMGGYAVDLLPDHYPDGRPCWVASHPQLPGCTAYADTDDEALSELELVRRAYLNSSMRHSGSMQAVSSTTSAHWQAQTAPAVWVTVAPTKGASPALQTA